MEDQDQDESITRPDSEDEALLEEIRDDYKYFSDYWRKAREERAVDMRYLCGDPWSAKERKAREDLGRICINHDELNQYIFQGTNNLRQNKRGIKIEPKGNGANDKTAELRQDLVRTIEYDSQALAAYLGGAQDMYEGSYGFFRIGRKYAVESPDEDDPHAFDQEIVIKPIPNPDSVLYDPMCKEADWSDARKCIVVEPMSRAAFKAAWPNARASDFSVEDMNVAPGWISEQQVIVAEYWKIVTKRRTIKRNGKSRVVEDKTVMQYITNGIEILERTPQPGTEIPIPAMIGLERYVDEGGTTERKLLSLTRLARDPQMSLAYLNSQEMEESGLSPKVPYRGFTGAFETDRDGWENLNKDPRAFIQEDPVYDQNGQLLPRVMREQFVPNFQAYEVAKDSCRRAVQAAMGISPLPTAAQRSNEKSGVALEKIQTEQAIGSYHFTDGYDRAVTRAGRIVDSWMKATYDNERELSVRRENDSNRLVKLNTEDPYLDEHSGKMEHHVIGDEEHRVTVSTGPSWESQRAAVDDFLNTLIGELPKLPVAPPQAQKLLAMAIQMKELGPKGDEMAEIISPTQQDQSGQLQQMQQQAQQQGQLMQAMQAELQKLQLEKQGKVVDNEYKIALEKMKAENALAIAEVSTKAQQLSERMQTFADMMQQFHSQAHDAGMQAQQQVHDQGMAQQQQEAAAQQQQAQAQQQPPQVQQ